MKRAEDILRDLWNNIKHTNIQIIGVPEEEEKKKGYEKIFEEIIVKNFPNIEKEIVNQVQEATTVPYRKNPRRNTSRHILTKFTKTKQKERILKVAREKQQVKHKGNSTCLTADLSTETLQARREWQDIFKVLKGKNLQPTFSSVQSLSHVRLFATPWMAARQASLSITNSQSPSKPLSIESVMPSNHLILCCPLLLLPSRFPSIRVFSNESVLCIR